MPERVRQLALWVMAAAVVVFLMFPTLRLYTLVSRAIGAVMGVLLLGMLLRFIKEQLERLVNYLSTPRRQ